MVFRRNHPTPTEATDAQHHPSTIIGIVLVSLGVATFVAFVGLSWNLELPPLLSNVFLVAILGFTLYGYGWICIHRPNSPFARRVYRTGPTATAMAGSCLDTLGYDLTELLADRHPYLKVEDSAVYRATAAFLNALDEHHAEALGPVYVGPPAEESDHNLLTPADLDFSDVVDFSGVGETVPSHSGWHGTGIELRPRYRELPDPIETADDSDTSLPPAIRYIDHGGDHDDYFQINVIGPYPTDSARNADLHRLEQLPLGDPELNGTSQFFPCRIGTIEADKTVAPEQVADATTLRAFYAAWAGETEDSYYNA
jgi:hypothetical protein